MSDYAGLHGYGTAEDLPIQIPRLQPSGDPTEAYRIGWGFYSTGESGAWTLAPQALRRFIYAEVFGDNLPLKMLFEMLTFETTAFRAPTEGFAIGDVLLDRIRARREKIKAQRGVLAESYPLIRQDRDR